MKKMTKKRILLSTLIPLGVLATTATTFAFTSCNSSNQDNVVIKGNATYDKEKSTIKLNTTSTIKLVANDGYTITAINSVKVGDSVLATTSYDVSDDLEQVTIKSYAMKSTKIQISVLTEFSPAKEVISISSATYTGGTIEGSYINASNLKVEAYCADTTTQELKIDKEYKVFLDDEDITSAVATEEGYIFDEVGTYNLTIKAGKNWKKTRVLPIEIKADIGNVREITEVTCKTKTAGQYLKASDFTIKVKFVDGTTGSISAGPACSVFVNTSTNITAALRSNTGWQIPPAGGTFVFTFKTQNGKTKDLIITY